jgi:branched-chain amino acid transport system ATP-binding protein
MLDEPSLGLAPLLVQEIIEIIQKIRQEGITILLVEQNAFAALKISDHAYVLETGCLMLKGSGEELLKDEKVKKAYLGE